MSRATAARQGYELNQPVLVMPGARPLPSLLAVFGHCVVIDTVKPAEDGDGIVVRAYQSMDRSTVARFTVALPADSVTECNMLEEPLADTDFRNGSWTAEFTPFKVRSFPIHGVKPIAMEEEGEAS